MSKNKYEDVICASCNGDGYRMSCPDDICRATGECRHGNGYSKCYDCDGNGYVTIDTETNKIVSWEQL